VKTILRLSIPKLLLIAGFFLVSSVAEAQIALWTYEPQNGAITGPTPNTGTGTSAIVNLGGGTITPMIRTGEDPAGTGCGTQNGANAWAFEPFDPGASNESNGAQFKASTVGYQNIFFTWDQRTSNTGPNTVRLQYTTDGTTWTNFTMTTANTTYCKGSLNNGRFEMDVDGDKYRRVAVDLSSITSANNNANFGVRVLAAHYQLTGQFRQAANAAAVAGTTGTWRFDNVKISGTLIPGPNPSVLSAVAPTTLCAGSSGNIKVTITGGQGPFTVVYNNGTSNVTVNNYTSGNNISVSPAAGTTTTYTLVSVTNANGQAGTGNSNTGNSIIVRPVLSISASNYSACAAVSVNLNAATSVTYSPAGGVLSYSVAIASPTAYTGATIASYTYTYTYMGCSVTSAPVTFTRNALATVITPPSTAAETRCSGYAFTPLTVTASADATSYQWYYDANNTLGGQISAGAADGGATATYTPQANFIGTRYYTCRIFNACGNFYSAYSGALTVKSTTWNGTVWSNGIPDSSTSVIFAGNYSSSADLNACTVQVTSGNVVFNPGHSLIIENGLTVSGGTLTFENNASLVQINNTTNVGTVTYKRNTTPVRRYDYTYWSSPVDSQIMANLSPLTLSDKYFWWNTAIYNWASITAPGITPMTVGQGYIIRAPQTFDPVTPAIYNGAFQGIPNNGDYPVSIAISGANDLNLLGNPYPSALDADAFLSPSGPNASILGGTIYLWTHNTPINPLLYTQSDYAIYNSTGGVGTAGGGTGNANVPNGYIAAGQAFFAKGINSGGTAVFQNNMRVSGNNDQFFKPVVSHAPQTLEKNRLWLELKNNQGAYKQILVGYIASATNEKDRNFDGDAVDGGNVVGMYSILGNDKLGIQGRALPFDSNDQVPLGYKTTVAGNFDISLSNFDGLFSGQDVYLEDKLFNIIHNLKQSAYSFSTAIGTFDERFVLRYTDGTLGTINPYFNNAIIIYKNHEKIIAKSGSAEIKSIAIYDMTGRLLIEKDNINTIETSLGSPLSHGVLIVRLVTVSNQIIERKIIN
jgi:hypothetical protein